MTPCLERLIVSNIRNLACIDLQLGPKFNVFIGQNGSGKTSVLEALHLLGLGRSFRTRSVSQLIRFGSVSCLVRGMLTEDQYDGSSGVWLAVEKGQDPAMTDADTIALLRDEIAELRADHPSS